MNLENRDAIRLLIVGRPNVGKSTLFNRLLGRKKALVLDTPGVTRDRLQELAIWKLPDGAWPIRLIDTGGLVGETFDAEITRQVELGLEVADVALVLFDGRAGMTPQDKEALARVRRHPASKRVKLIGVVNKLDESEMEGLMSDFFAAGLEDVVGVSAEHARGIDELKQLILTKKEISPLNEEELETYEAARRRKTGALLPRIAVLGRPNVGKSTLVNALLGEQRMITSSVAGTTVDSVDSEVELDGHRMLLVDTAGIRRKSKTAQGVEVLSVVLARKALERADLTLLVVDGETGVSDQDGKIAGLIEESGTSVVVIVNKWDTQKRNRAFTKKVAADHIRKGLRFMGYAPIVFTSALKGEGLEGLGGLIKEIMEQKHVKVPSRELTDWMREELDRHNPNNLRVFFVHQSGNNPPTFVTHVNDSRKVHFSVERHLINEMRAQWGFMGSPVRLKFQSSKDRGLAKDNN